MEFASASSALYGPLNFPLIILIPIKNKQMHDYLWFFRIHLPWLQSSPFFLPPCATIPATPEEPCPAAREPKDQGHSSAQIYMIVWRCL